MVYVMCYLLIGLALAELHIWLSSRRGLRLFGPVEYLLLMLGWPYFLYVFVRTLLGP